MTYSTDTACMRDVIEHSLLIHPTLYAEELEAQANMHQTYSRSLPALSASSLHARAIASSMAESLLTVAAHARDPRKSLDDLTQAVPAFAIAAKLQCLSTGEQQRIATRSNPRDGRLA